MKHGTGVIYLIRPGSERQVKSLFQFFREGEFMKKPEINVGAIQIITFKAYVRYRERGGGG